MSVEITGERALHARIVALQSQGKPIMGLIGLTAVREQKRLVPRKTGNLGRTIHLERVTAREAFTVASATYAMPVEFGSRPHVITAKKGKALRFAGKGVPVTLAGRVKAGAARKLGSGAYVFRASVNHPGTKAQPFMVPGARKALNLAAVRDVIVSVWNRAA